MSARFELVAIAFLRAAGGRMHVLLAASRDGIDLFDGEPVLLVEHRPGSDPEAMHVEGADVVPDALVAVIRTHARAPLARLVDDAFDDAGELDGQRLVGRSIAFTAPDADDAG